MQLHQISSVIKLPLELAKGVPKGILLSADLVNECITCTVSDIGQVSTQD